LQNAFILKRICDSQENDHPRNILTVIGYNIRVFCKLTQWRIGWNKAGHLNFPSSKHFKPLNIKKSTAASSAAAEKISP